RKIEIYGLTPSETEQIGSSSPAIPSSRQLSIQTSIRLSTIQYLRQKLLGLPELPDEKRFEQLKQQHNQLIEKRIRLEKEMALMEQERFRRQRNQQTETNIRVDLNTEDGYCPEQPNNHNHFKQWKTNIFDEQERYAILSEQNPIIQQMNIIRLYIKQAKNDNRYE
ncbi:hypothetical protein BLA29_010420, partial [Euroglyphus maynei]